MTYSGAAQAKTAREGLGKALEALQQDPNIPEEVLAVAQNIARAVGGLFEAEHASSERDGKACVKTSLGFLSQTLALLQDVGDHPGIATATEVLAKSMSMLYPLTTAPSIPPAAAPQAAMAAPSQPAMPIPAAAPPPTFTAPAPQAPAPQAPRQAAPAAPPATAPYRGGPRTPVEANIGATTESNFYVGFSGEVSEGGVFLSTYEVLAQGTHVQMLVTLPGGFQFAAPGVVRFVRDPMDFSADSEPGMGVQFEGLDPKSRQLVMRFIAKRPPIFYDE
ncbi:MAG: TIGR02266 family protein [Deltaproteobacteria bacterium]|nr:TIGR02266 family protein [Deltaproteobacteria bacterium]